MNHNDIGSAGSLKEPVKSESVLSTSTVSTSDQSIPVTDIEYLPSSSEQSIQCIKVSPRMNLRGGSFLGLIKPPSEETRWERIQTIAKYTYVTSAIIFGFGVAAAQSLSDPFDQWLDRLQSDLLTFLIDDSVLYILLVLFVITVLKSIGVKDVLGIRTIAVVLLSYRMAPDPKGLTVLIAMLWSGVFSSISKLIEYRVIGRELQVVQGVPVHIVFLYARKVFSKFSCMDRRKTWLEALDPKWAIEISTKSRDDTSMDIWTNLNVVLTKYQLRRRGNTEENQEIVRTGWRLWLWRTMLFIVSVVWTSCIEWVQPITELFLFLHNWHLSVRNVVIIVCSEFLDFDKVVETWILIGGARSGDLVGAKVDSVLSKSAFWAMGYTLILPPTLAFAYLYHRDFIDIKPNQETMAGASGTDSNGQAVAKNSTSDTCTATENVETNGVNEFAVSDVDHAMMVLEDRSTSTGLS